MDINQRSYKLIGKEKVKLLSNKKILIVGLGGVGGACFESLIRSSFLNITIIDHDVVSQSNLNRQILYTSNDIGKAKVDVAKKRGESINHDVCIRSLNMRLNNDNIKDLGNDFDYIVDAIDDVKAKIALIKYACNNNITIISSMGMGNRLDPQKVIITTLNKTNNDPLAKSIRSSLRKELSFDLSKVNVVFSSELPIVRSPSPTSMMMVPNAAGLAIAYFLIKTIIQ